MIFFCFAGKRVLNFKMSLNNKYTVLFMWLSTQNIGHCIYFMLELESGIRNQEFLNFMY